MTILILDNYDSFAYNLVQYVGQTLAILRPDEDPRETVVVRRNDEIDIAGIRTLNPNGIVVSPGPGTPEEAGISVEIFRSLAYPTLGVCLGHQALCVANGTAVGHAPDVVHGKTSRITHDGEGIFAGIESPIAVGRYHSLCVTNGLSDSLIETARTDDVIMGVRHTEKPHEGVQFHPESILTGAGERMIENFCRYCL